MLKILFVCTGNTCRSSMAEILAKKMIADRGWQDRLSVSSAGIAALDGMPASPLAAAVMSRRGLDLTGHKSRMAVAPLLAEADLILTMTEGHKTALAGQVSAGKLFTLGEYSGEPGDIADPIDGSPEIYQQCADQLERLVTRALEKVLKEKDDWGKS